MPSKFISGGQSCLQANFLYVFQQATATCRICNIRCLRDVFCTCMGMIDWVAYMGISDIRLIFQRGKSHALLAKFDNALQRPNPGIDLPRE